MRFGSRLRFGLSGIGCGNVTSKSNMTRRKIPTTTTITTTKTVMGGGYHDQSIQSRPIRRGWGEGRRMGGFAPYCPDCPCSRYFSPSVLKTYMPPISFDCDLSCLCSYLQLLIIFVFQLRSRIWGEVRLMCAASLWLLFVN